MARVVVPAKVHDLEVWEEGFRTHGDLFRRMSLSVSYYGMNEDDRSVAVYAEPTDLDRWMEILRSSDTVDAMDADGIVPDTVKVFVLDREFRY
ncbi:MAG: hypothetical protein R3195_17350 [Gemmatimonadota bacterium]|nr:hypothetical protein [Gemmatimonadota bacterium]